LTTQTFHNLHIISSHFISFHIFILADYIHLLFHFSLLSDNSFSTRPTSAVLGPMGLGRSSPKLFSPFYTFITFYHIFYIFTLFHLSFAVYRYTPHLPYSQTLRYITFPDSLPPDSYPPFSTFHFLRQIHFSLSTPNSLFTFRPSFLFPFFSNFIFYTPYSSPSAVFILGSLHPRPCGPRALGGSPRCSYPRPCGPRALGSLHLILLNLYIIPSNSIPDSHNYHLSS
jgi:hypothetical protein